MTGLARTRGERSRRRAGVGIALSSALLALGLAFPTSALAREAAPEATSTAAEARGLRLVAHHNLGGGGLNGDVAVVGNIAIVGAGLVPNTGYHTERYNPLGCYTVSAKIVDLSRPARPRVIATIPMPQGSAAMDVDALRVRTPSFSGVLAAIAIDDGPSQAGPTGCSPAAGHNTPIYAERGVAYYDLNRPSSPQFLGRYQADADAVPANAPPCGPPPQGDRLRCATGQHSVDLVQRRDGRVLSISTEPGALVQNLPSGDVRIVDVTNPRSPVQVGFFPPLDARPHHFSPNGCAPFVNAHSGEFYAGGTRALVAYMDAGVFNLDLSNPAVPARVSQLGYQPIRSLEGNAGYVTTTTVGRRLLALVAEEDWWAPRTEVQIDAPASIAGTKFACEGTPTLFDPDRNAQLYVRTGQQARGEIVYVGRGCAAGATAGADPYLADPAGKIAFIDSARVTATQPDIPAAGANCRFDVRTRRAQDAGAIAVLYGRVQSRPFAASPQAIAWGGMPTGLTIPGTMIDEPDANALRSTLCPSVVAGGCTGGQAVTGAIVDRPGEWGALRVFDLTRPTAARLVTSHRVARARIFPPPDLGVYAPGRPVARGGLAYTAWNSAGVRVLDVTGRRAKEIAFFVPNDTSDPTGTLPGEVQVFGVALAGRHVVITDVHSGLYVLEPTCPNARGLQGNHVLGSDAGETLVGTRGRDVICGRGGADRITGLGGNDVLLGGDGNDRIVGGLGRDVLAGGAGRDELLARDGSPDRVNGGAGSDRARVDRSDRVALVERRF